jgi:mannan endo-1,4-beta-mannosidase
VSGLRPVLRDPALDAARSRLSSLALVFCALTLACASCKSTKPAPPAAPVACAPGAPAPADPLASDGAKAVLAYLAGLPSKSDKRVVSGQRYRYPQTDWAPIQASGQTPGLMGVSWVCGNATSPAGCDGKPFLHAGLLQTVADHFHAGGLVQVAESIGNPVTNGAVTDTAFTQADYDHLLTPGDPVNASYFAQLDVIAAGYAFLQEQGVTVLVHALPEMNGDWLWWSKGTPEQYKALVQMEFAYLTRAKGLHNLLFTYAPNVGNGRYADFYPGDAFIDIVGLDYYLDIDGPIPKADGYDEMTTQVAPCKPFAFVEFGPLPGGSTTKFSPRDYSQLIIAIRESMPKVTYWYSWNSVWGMGIADPATGQSHQNVRELLADPWVVNMGDIVLPSVPASR